MVQLGLEGVFTQKVQSYLPFVTKGVILYDKNFSEGPLDI